MGIRIYKGICLISKGILAKYINIGQKFAFEICEIASAKPLHIAGGADPSLELSAKILPDEHAVYRD